MDNRKVKLLVAAHKHVPLPTSKLYLPIHVGASNTQMELPFQKDDEGENISMLNPYFSELTAQYWGWKNLECDYIGLVHYRRYFANEKVKYQEGMNLDEVVLDQETLLQQLKPNTVFVPKKRRYYIETMYSHYANTFMAEHLDCTRQIIGELTPEYLPSFDKIMKQTWGYMFNMYIADKQTSDQYSEWLFLILFELHQRIDSQKMTAFEARFVGRVSELLLNVWLDYQQIIVEELETLDAFQVNWIEKIGDFLKAKFFKKKYTQSH